jgi:hypothetical protein
MISLRRLRGAALLCGVFTGSFLLSAVVAGAQAVAPPGFVEVRIVAVEGAVGQDVSIRYANGDLPTVAVRRHRADPADVALAVEIAVQLAKRYPRGVPGGTIEFSPRAGRSTPRSVDPAAERRAVGYLERLERTSASKNGIVVIVDTARARRE